MAEKSVKIDAYGKTRLIADLAETLPSTSNAALAEAIDSTLLPTLVTAVAAARGINKTFKTARAAFAYGHLATGLRLGNSFAGLVGEIAAGVVLSKTSPSSVTVTATSKSIDLVTLAGNRPQQFVEAKFSDVRGRTGTSVTMQASQLVTAKNAHVVATLWNGDSFQFMVMPSAAVTAHLEGRKSLRVHMSRGADNVFRCNLNGERITALSTSEMLAWAADSAHAAN